MENAGKARNEKVATDLEQYRNLIALQKQMIQLKQQLELTKRECDALRKPIGKASKKTPAAVRPVQKQAGFRQSAKKAFRGLPKRAAKKFGSILVIGLSIGSAAQKVVKAVGR